MNNKNRIDAYIPIAIEALNECGIVVNGEIDKSFRSQISSFGASVAISGFKQAVKVFSTDAKNDNSKISRTKLLIAIDYVINGKNNIDEDKKAATICKKILEKSPEDLKTQENKYLDAAVALKVAMNLFHLK